MKTKTILSIASTLVVGLSLFTASTASAQEKDGGRFRGGVGLEGGAMIVPGGGGSFGLAGVQGQIGYQISNLIGVYAVPNFDIVFGKVGGVNVGAALMVDFTPTELITVGAGASFADFAAIGGTSNGTGLATATVAGGSLYGGRLHLGINPAVSIGENGIRRKGLVIGIDVNLLTGPFASETATSGGGLTATVSDRSFVIQPMASISYQAF